MIADIILWGSKWTIAEILILIVCVAGGLGVLWVALQQFGVKLPEWLQIQKDKIFVLRSQIAELRSKPTQ